MLLYKCSCTYIIISYIMCVCVCVCVWVGVCVCVCVARVICFHRNCYTCRSTTCKRRPAGRVRPATRFCPAREIVLNYNGNWPAACHRPPLRLRFFRPNRLKTTLICFTVSTMLSCMHDGLWILISNRHMT